MTRDEAQAAVGIVGAVTALGLFLPSIERSWDGTDAEAATRVRSGEAVYLAAAAAITLLAAYGEGSPVPFVVGFGAALLIVAFQEFALRHRPQRDDPGGY